MWQPVLANKLLELQASN